METRPKLRLFRYLVPVIIISVSYTHLLDSYISSTVSYERFIVLIKICVLIISVRYFVIRIEAMACPFYLNGVRCV